MDSSLALGVRRFEVATGSCGGSIDAALLRNEYRSHGPPGEAMFTEVAVELDAGDERISRE